MKKTLTVTLLVTAMLITTAQYKKASAAPSSPSDKVEICHRTHSVTNPYVRITVAQRSVGNGNGKHGGNSHDQYSTILFPSGKPVPNVFNSSITYTPAPQKKWGDIIPLNDVSGNPLANPASNVAGLNFSGIGLSIYNGTGAYAGICKTMTPRDYYEVEVIEGGQNPSDVLQDMEEFDSDEFASALSACGGSFLSCSVGTLGAPTAFAPTTTIASTTTISSVTTVASTTPVNNSSSNRGSNSSSSNSTRKLKGKIWIDANRNGVKDGSEKILSNFKVTVSAGSGNTSTLTYTVTTDASGNYEVSDIPEGNWVVRAASLPSSNYEMVYDSDSVASATDWVVLAAVPSTGEATADFATALSAEAVAAGVKDTLGATELPETGPQYVAGVLLMALVLMLLGMFLVIMNLALRRE